MKTAIEGIAVFDDFFSEAFRAKLETSLYEMQYDIANCDRHDTQKYCNGEPSEDFIERVGLREELEKTPLAPYAHYEIMSTGTNVDTPGLPHYCHIHTGQFVFLYYPAKTWRHEWGGETLFYGRDGREIVYASPYTPNRCIFFEGMTSHTIRSPTTLVPFPRVTFGIFFQKKHGFFEKLELP